MAEGFGGVLLAGYRLAGRLVMPVIPFVLSARADKGKEERDRLGERYGRASVARPDGRLVWVHAASVGETNAVLPLVDRLAAAGERVLLTTVTVTSAEIARRGLPAAAIHQFAPLDVAPWVDRFLAHWRPSLAVFVESEIWPATTARLAAAGVPHVIVNGRMSDRSFRQWRRLASLSRAVLRPIALCLAQSDADADRLRRLGAPRVAVSGNLKFDSPPPSASPAALAELCARLGDRPVWIAASTHDGEEAMVADVHERLVAVHPRLLTIVAPRHPARGDAVAALLAARGAVPARRSHGEPPPDGAGLYLADTLGELGLFYRAVPVAFLGGSLVPHGGQNPIEPVKLGAVVLHGPHVANFAGVYAALDAAGGAERVADPAALAAALAALLADPAERHRRRDRAAAALAPFAGALGRTLAALAPFLPAGRPGGIAPPAAA